MKRLAILLLLFTIPAFATEYPYNSVVRVYADGIKLSGVITGENEVLTAYHGIANNVFVYKEPAEVIKVCAEFDLMLLKTRQTFPKERIAKLADRIEPKETVWVIGYPRRKTAPRVFRHNVSGLGNGYIETFPYVMRGNSGSGVFNEKDELVGIATTLTLEIDVISVFSFNFIYVLPGYTIVPSIYTIKYFLGRSK